MTFRLLISLAKKISRKNVHRNIGHFVSEIPAGSRVLNIGAGGQVNKVIQENLRSPKIAVESSDIDPDRKPDHVDDICNTKLEAESYDFIVCSDVIEHVLQPHEAAESIHKLLKPGGKCLIATPYLFPTHDAPHDYFRFTEFGLKHLFSKFQILEMKPKNSWWETIILLMWRTMWLGDLKTKLVVWVISVPILPCIPLFYLFSRGKGNATLTSGFIMSLCKNG